MDTNAAQEKINKLFGSYRAEWLDDKVFDLFSEPTYFPELLTKRPCVLLGGRGTGKTTVLRCLSYEGQFALQNHNIENFKNQPFFGIFYRVDTNRVTAFRGGEKTDEQWAKLFGHYLNLVLGGLFVRFLVWHQGHYPTVPSLTEDALKLIASAFNLPARQNVQGLSEALKEALIAYEAKINNIAEEQPSDLTIQGVPIDVLVAAALELPQFKGRDFYFLLDEYENFVDYQQRAVNTIIKHAGALFSVKIGVRELGWRRRDTLNTTEQLVSPADYIRINLADRLFGEPFEQFALKVCDTRIARIDEDAGPLDVKALFPGMSDEEEAELLVRGSDPFDDDSKAIIATLPLAQHARWSALTVLEKVFLVTWPENRSNPARFADSVSRFANGDSKSRERYDNYKHSLLFWLRRKKTGIRKYYAGWDVYAKLAAGNIRFFLELIDRALIFHLQQGEKWGDPVSAKTQTETAQYVGRKNLEELEGVDVDGAKLTKLLLGLGRIFQVMAADPLGHSPEVNQFQLGESPSSGPIVDRATTLIRSAVNHLAILRLVGSKPSDIGDTKDSDYAVHPIFSAFFVFSYRRKRKMTLSCEQIVSLVEKPKGAIQEVLSNNGRSEDEELPEQMNLFEDYYARSG